MPWQGGGKTVKMIVEEISGDPTMTRLEIVSNSSFQMNPSVATEKIVEVLKSHTGIKKVNLTDCGITDEAVSFLAELLKENHVIEELALERNRVGAEGAKALADALVINKGLKTLNLLQNATRNFGEDTLGQFITMFHYNITLTKVLWPVVNSAKNNMLIKLLTRNVEIKRRQDIGEDSTSYLPSHLRRDGGDPASTASEDAPLQSDAAPAVKETPGRFLKTRVTVEDMEQHISQVEAVVGELEAQARKQYGPRIKGHEEKIKALFDKIDIDNDGYLDASELKAVVAEYSGDAFDEKQFFGWFDVLGQDGTPDSKLDLEEFGWYLADICGGFGERDVMPEVVKKFEEIMGSEVMCSGTTVEGQEAAIGAM